MMVLKFVAKMMVIICWCHVPRKNNKIPNCWYELREQNNWRV